MNPLQIAGSILGAALAVGAAGIAWHCWTVTQEYATFKDGVAKAGKEAKARADKKEADDRKSKEKSDAQSKTDRARIADLSKRLRDANSSRSAVSWLAPTPRSADLICFNRDELDRAIQHYQSGILGIVEKGAEATMSLEVAKRWAQETSQPSPR